MHLTTKQIEQISIIGAGNVDGSCVDLDQLVERLSYKPSKQSMQFSLRALIKHGLIEKLGREVRRGQSRRLIGITPLGRHFAAVYVPSVKSAILSDEEE